MILITYTFLQETFLFIISMYFSTIRKKSNTTRSSYWSNIYKKCIQIVELFAREQLFLDVFVFSLNQN